MIILVDVGHHDILKKYRRKEKSTGIAGGFIFNY